jgi:hypothetical protein
LFIEKSCFLAQLNPFLPNKTWLRLPFCLLPRENLFLPRASSLKKLAKGFFFSSILLMEEKENLRKGLNLEPFG